MSTWTKTHSEFARVGAEAVAHSVKLGEVLTASGEVLMRRGEIIADALRDPINADYAELGRLLPEKVAALSLSAIALGTEGLKMQQQMFTLMSQMGWMMMRPTPQRIAAFADSATRSGSHSLKVGQSALAPVHKAVTANAKRLKRGD